MKVFAVSHGSYSDYRIFAMFSIRAAAEAAIASLGRDGYGDERVEEWDVFDAVPARITLYVKESYGGNVREFRQVYPGWDDPMHTYVGRVTRGLGFGKWSNNHGDHYRYWGLHKARVHKAFDDYHAQRQAEKAGVA